MRKTITILIFTLIAKFNFAQIKYDNGGIRENGSPIGEYITQGNS